MFHGKFTYFKSLNGKIYRIEKDFDDPRDFEAFVLGGTPMHLMGHHNQAQKSSCCPTGDCMVDEIEKLSSGSRISDYHRELEEMESAEREQAELLEKKKHGLQELRDLRAKFADKERWDIVDRIDTDIRALEEEIKNMEK